MTDVNGSTGGDLHLVAEEFGRLVAIHFSEFEPGWVESVHFDFEAGYLRVDVNGDNDTVKWKIGPRRGATPGEAPDSLRELLSQEVRWIWLMTNHRGFTDGFQIEFRDEPSTNVQLMAEASRLWIYKLTALDS